MQASASSPRHDSPVDEAVGYNDYAGVGLLEEQRSRGGRPLERSFPVALHYLLSEPDEVRDFQGIISWQPHGRCFMVRDKKRFVEEVLPK